jgi:ketosteroid isomerase-like protein
MKTSLLRRTIIVSLLAVVSLFFLYFLTTDSSAPVHAQPSEKLEMTGNITSQAAAEACLAVLKENLQAASDQDATAYAATLVAAARAETSQELADFFAEEQLQHTLLSFEVVKQETESMLVAAQQKTISPKDSSYRDHITEAYHTFVKEADGWKIQETVMTNTEFL